MNTRKNAGFTLIELLVVVLIVGILAAVALPQYNRAVLRSRFVQAQTLAKSFADAATRYYLANGTALEYWTDLDISVPAGYWVSDETGGGWMYGPNIVCDLKGGDDENIVCFISSGGVRRAVYVQFFGPYSDQRECWAKKDDADAQALCKGFGGTESGNSTHDTCVRLMGGCARYILP